MFRTQTFTLFGTLDVPSIPNVVDGLLTPVAWTLVLQICKPYTLARVRRVATFTFCGTFDGAEYGKRG
jgi:hypothetical protein